MQAEAALFRVGLWFGVLILAIVAAAMAKDAAYAAHAVIIAGVALLLLTMSAGRFDPDLVRAASGFAGPQRPDYKG